MTTTSERERITAMPGGRITANAGRAGSRHLGLGLAGGPSQGFTDDLATGRGTGGSAGALAEDPVAVFRSVAGAALGWGSERGSGCGPDCLLCCGGTGRSRMFRAVPGQVRAVREFVRLVLASHPAADDAVAVACELASNTVAHSGSGRVGGMFTVHVTAMGQAAAGLAVTELRGDGFPQVQDAGPDAVAGRGLVIVRALTSLFRVSDGEEVRILLATIPAPPGGEAR